ncbi:MAG: LysR family transcriptional regulator [Actinobacteria bacterium]|nr:LysR family transcriptional regulator [Actinomycetota bacterium]
MELDLFKSFVAVAEARSFTGAARAMHSTQPTLSRQIARLEVELGTRLFERYGRHVEPTLTGQALLPLARAIISRTDEILTLSRDQAGTGSGTVRFGAVGNVMALLLTPILASFFASYPRVSVDLIEMDDARLEEAVVSGELDCAVITPWGSTRAATQHLLTEEILLIMPRNHPLASEPAVALSMLANESVLLPRAGMNAGNVTADAFRRAGVEARFSRRANYPELTKALVRTGLGVAPMPKMLAVAETLEGLIAVPFDKPLYRDLKIIYPRDRPLPGAARALMVHIRGAVLGRGALDQS